MKVKGSAHWVVGKGVVSGVGKGAGNEVDSGVGNEVGEGVELEVGGKVLSIKMSKIKSMQIVVHYRLICW